MASLEALRVVIHRTHQEKFAYQQWACLFYLSLNQAGKTQVQEANHNLQLNKKNKQNAFENVERKKKKSMQILFFLFQ